MTKTKQTKTTKSNTTPTSITTLSEIGELDWNPGQDAESYVVVRDGFRVSDNEYIAPDWPQAVYERNFWQRVVDRFPDGTKVEIVKYDKKKHRVTHR